MWKCKKCGSEVLKKNIKVYENRIDENLSIVDSINEYDLKESIFVCDDCENESAYIEKIAIWED